MANTQWLLDNGFQYLGAWTTPKSVVHRVTWLRRRAGLYSFVVGNEVRYIGKAEMLHRRLRNYSGRSFKPSVKKKIRHVHAGIRDAIAAGERVDVYVLLVNFAERASLLQTEASLIRKACPSWDRSLTQ